MLFRGIFFWLIFELLRRGRVSKARRSAKRRYLERAFPRQLDRMRWPRGPYEGEERHRGTRETIWRSTTRNRRKQGRQERDKTRTLVTGTPSLNDEARASFRARDSHKPTRARSSEERAQGSVASRRSPL